MEKDDPELRAPRAKAAEREWVQTATESARGLDGLTQEYVQTRAELQELNQLVQAADALAARRSTAAPATTAELATKTAIETILDGSKALVPEITAKETRVAELEGQIRAAGGDPAQY